LLHYANRVEYTAPCRDSDGDGYGSTGSPSCTRGSPKDCNDGDPRVHPGAVEIPFNGIDDDCDPTTPQGNCQSVASLEDGVAANPWAPAWAVLPACLMIGLVRLRLDRGRKH